MIHKLLLDTRVFLWWRGDVGRMTPEARTAIGRADLVFVSVASAWEAAIKIALGKLHLPDSVEAGIVASGFERLPIAFGHAAAVATLPAHHRDPFDRMLVVQAQCEDLTLVTHDQQLRAYDVPILWA